jgi:hypothetical protein
VWLGTAWPGDALSAAERWPVVKALEQFGSFSGLQSGPRLCRPPVQQQNNQGQMVLGIPCTLATIDWSHGIYHSRYVVFDHRDLLDTQGHAGAPLSATEQQLYRRYVESGPHAADNIVDLHVYSTVPTDKHFPLVAIDAYLETDPQIPLAGDLAGSPEHLTSNVRPPLPMNAYLDALQFGDVQTALAAGKSPASNPQLVQDVNAEANVMIALICHADGGQPKSVCSRPVVRRLLHSIH